MVEGPQVSLRELEERALDYAKGLRRDGCDRDEISKKVREEFGPDVDPPVLAMVAIREVDKEKQPRAPKSYDDALKKATEK